MLLRTPSDLSGTVVVITGASSGIGRATAIALARRGASVALAARGAERLRSATDECLEFGVDAIAVPTDVADRAQVQELAQRAIEHFGRIDVWINNASVMAYGRFEDVPEDVEERVIATNLSGVMFGCRAALDHFLPRQRGLIINVASLYARLSSPYVASYVTAKFGVLGFSEVLRQELHDQPDIDVVTVLPSSVDTPIFQHAANYTGRRVRPIPPIVDIDRVVAAILRNIERPRAEVVVGVVGHVFAWARTWSPPLYRRWAPPVMEQLAFYRGSSAPDDEGNVHHPAPPFGQERGGWHQPERRKNGLRNVLTMPVRLLRG